MGIAVLLFGLLVGIFHFQGAEPNVSQQEMLAANTPEPASYQQEAAPERRPEPETRAVPVEAAPANSYAGLAAATNQAELTQTLANLVAAKPQRAANILTIALAQSYEDHTLGDVATLAATATKAAPGQAPAIAGAVARSFRDQSDPALAAAVATIVSLVPEQSREIGLVVGAVIGNDVAALGMVAQTVAISVGEETFSSLSEGSGVSMSVLMKESSRLGVNVPFDVPNYAAQLAPSASMVAGSDGDGNASEGDM